MADEPIRIIYYGDNLDILRANVSTGSVDLVYLDPPFKSQQQYNLLFRTARGEPATAQVRAFSDTWKWGLEAKATYEQLMEDPLVPGKVSQMVDAFYRLLEPSEMLAYLVMMTPRLMELHRVLKPTGSLYLHCDPAASHYLKIVLDTIFGPGNFRNEIIFRRTNVHSKLTKQYGPIHDTILFYSKTDKHTFHPGLRPYLKPYIEERFKSQDTRGRYQLNYLTGLGVRKGESGQPWRGFDPTEHGRHWAIPASLRKYLPMDTSNMTIQEQLEHLYEADVIHLPQKAGGQPMYHQYVGPGIPYQDIWAYQPHTQNLLVGTQEAIDEDVKWLDQEDEKLGYQTQKPAGLLKRIITTSTNPGDLVLDPFCGCGTALAAAEELGRSWIGIDVTYLAVDVMARRLRDHFPGITFEIRGQPQDEEGALALAERDRFQFQVWALSQVGAQSLDPDRKGADRGIDGYLPFQIGREKHERAIVQVKSGHVGVREMRDLRGTLEREKAPFALLITLEHPTAAMGREAADAGFYRVPATGEEVPRLQIITVRELLQGQRPKMPTTQVSPVPQAPRLRRSGGHQLPL